MKEPKVSVVIPAYNGCDQLAEAIQSVLDQSYPDFELIVVDDCSPEGATHIVAGFDDPRVRLIVHQENQGAIAARKSGVDDSSGAIIAFLDQDDRFHPDKLATHVAFLDRHPNVGVTYNSRFECDGDARTIRAIWQPPHTLTLADLVLGFPFAPSDTVMRRKLAQHEEIWDQSFVLDGTEKIFNGGEIVLSGRLALEGHQIADVGRTLNYRRYHPRRVFTDLAARCQAERACQDIIFNDARCPESVRALRDRAFTNIYLFWIYYAFAQNETALGQSFVHEAVRLTPSIVEGIPCELVTFLVDNIANESSLDLDETLTQVFAQMPQTQAQVSRQLEWAIARGHLIRGAQAMLWDRPKEGHRYLQRALALGAHVDEPFLSSLTYQLFLRQEAFGVEATQRSLRHLSDVFGDLGRLNRRRRLQGYFAVNRALEQYRTGLYDQVPRQVFQAITNDPAYLLNRGVVAILLRSVTGLHPKYGVG